MPIPTLQERQILLATNGQPRGIQGEKNVCKVTVTQLLDPGAIDGALEIVPR